MIQRESALFKSPKYYVFDNNSHLEIAKLNFGLPFNSETGFLEIPTYPKYYWHSIDYEATNLLDPKSWWDFKARMSNGRNEIIYSGTLNNKSSSSGLANRSLIGTIQSKQNDLLAIICGLYFLECDFELRDRSN